MSNLSCALLGTGPQLVECAKLLLQRGHHLSAIVSADGVVRDWAKAIGTPCVEPGEDEAKLLRRTPIDYLFSIVNHRIVSDEILALARRAAINFHDSPLPEYAGFNATAWAILDGRTRHAITWHVMSSQVDSGHILKQIPVDIRDDDTAFTLAAKCSEAAVQGFAELLDELSSGRERRTPQQGQGSFHTKYERPASSFLLRWDTTAEQLNRVVRAVTYVSEDNPLGRAKLLVGDRYVLCDELVLQDPTDAKPGSVLSLVDGQLGVSAAGRAVLLSGIATLEGSPLSATSLREDYGCTVGATLGVASPDALAALAAFDTAVCKRELAWVRRLAAQEAPRVNGVSLPSRDGKSRTQPLSVGANASQGTTPAHWLAAVAAYVSRVTESELVYVGHDDGRVPDALRSLFAAHLPVPMTVDAETSFSGLVAQAESQVQELKNTGTYARDVWTRYRVLRDRPVTSRRLPIVVQALNQGGTPANLGGAALTVCISPNGDVSLASDESVDAAVADHFARGLTTLLATAAKSPGLPIASLDLLTEAEKQLLLVEWQPAATSFAAERSVHELFEEQAARTPDKTAVVFRDRSLTFRELDERATAVAGALQAAGVAPQSLVGICVERSLNMMVGLLGILKAGAAYVPLDPAYPARRLSVMLEDSGAQFVVASRETLDRLPESAAQVLLIDALLADSTARATTPVKVESSSLAYVIFTSGSSGRPKGVMVTHRNVSNFFAGMDSAIGAEPGVWLAVTSISFDISVLELFWTLTRGFEVVIQEEGDQGNRRRQRPKGSSIPSQMGFGLFYFSADARRSAQGEGKAGAYRLLLEGARFADEHGFEAVWTPERHFHAFGGLYPNPAITSAAIATITRRVSIRAGSVVLPLHDPIRVAEEWSVVDNLSGGRVGLSFASGWHANDFALRPENYAPRREIMNDYIAEVKALWRGEAVTRKNGEGKTIEIRTLPPPVQSEPPMWLASAGNEATFRAAGSLGVNVLTNMLGQNLEDLRTKLAAYRSARAEAGYPGPGIVSVMLHTFVGADVEEVRRIVRQPFIDYLKSSYDLVKAAPWMFPAFRQPSRATAEDPSLDPASFTPEDVDALMTHAFERYFDTAGLFGTPEHCLAMIDSLKRIGVNEVACLVDFGVDADLVLDNLPHLARLRELSNTHEEDSSSYSVAEQIERHQVTHLQCTPSLVRLLSVDDRGFGAVSRLQKLLLGGEELPNELAQRLTSVLRGELLNMYGPTETTIWSTTARVEHGQGVTIGRPIANTQIRILDAQGRLAPPGTSGELCIGGEGVARGYFQRAELTAERFIPDPYAAANGARLYRTGDRARYLPDGRLEFLGRLDYQVKLNGYRIELGEIETALGRHAAVRQAVVVARTDANGVGSLAAYVVPSRREGEASGAESAWKSIWDETYRGSEDGTGDSVTDPRRDTTGWLSSYDGAPIPSGEMQEWLNHTVGRVLEQKPQRVLEIGCGTGMILFGCLPHVAHYTALDFSETALRKIGAELTPEESAKVALNHGAADTVGALSGEVDLVIINSVIQYFPSVEYLKQVLAGAIGRVRQGGRLFVGDVRSLDHLTAFHSDIAIHQAADETKASDVAAEANRRVANEGELALAPRFFADLVRDLPRVAGVDFQLKRGAAANEMSCFRYDVVVHLDERAPSQDERPAARTGLSRTAELDELLSASPDILVLDDVLNSRLSRQVALGAALRERPETALRELRTERHQPAEGIDPETLYALADYDVSVTWAKSGALDRFDAILHHRKKWSGPRLAPGLPPLSGAGVANTPSRRTNAEDLTTEWMGYLRQSLPEYMVPTDYVVLDALPLTPNGKVDRSKLPAPSRNTRRSSVQYAAPANELETTIAAVWQALLNVPRVGREDNLFDVGANSLLTVQAHNRLCKTLERTLSLVDMFRFPTVKALAAHLAATDSGAPRPASETNRADKRRDVMERRRAARAGRKETSSD